MLTTGPPAFDLVRFSRAIETGALDYLASQYAPDAEIKIMDPEHLPWQPTTVVGPAAIKAWRESLWTDYASHQVLKKLAVEDRVMFVERRVHHDGVQVSTSAAELQDGLITAQHTLVAWDDEPWRGGTSRPRRAVRLRNASMAEVLLWAD